jgi:hypothetical protein
VADLRVPIFLVVFQIGAVALAIVAGVGSLVLTRQSFELAVLRSRGFSRRALLLGQAIQATLSALVAFPIGLLLGVGLAVLASNSNGPTLPGVLFPIRLSGSAQALGIAGAVLGAAALLVLSVPHVRRTILEERRLVSREERPLLARIPVELFVAPVAFFAFVQLRGGAVRTTAQRESLDPLVLLTPTLIIFVLSFLSLRLLLFLLRRLDRRVGRARRLPTYLAARRLGRSPGTSFATSLLLVLAFGLLVVATSYRAIVLGNHEDSAHRAGSRPAWGHGRDPNRARARASRDGLHRPDRHRRRPRDLRRGGVVAPGLRDDPPGDVAGCAPHPRSRDADRGRHVHRDAHRRRRRRRARADRHVRHGRGGGPRRDRLPDRRGHLDLLD